MPDIPILNPRKEWECNSCGIQDVTNEARPHTRMHECGANGGLSLPLVEKAREREAGGLLRRKARVKPVVREDYVGKEKGLVYDESGRPIMAAVTEYADGSNDVAVFAPCVSVEMRF